MDANTLTQLLDVSVLKTLDALTYDRSKELQLQTQLRGLGYSPELTAAILTQAQLRVAAQEKFGPFAASMLFTRDGLAQATRLPVAAHHAARMLGTNAQVATPATTSPTAGDPEAPRIADLGCGIGADSMAMAGVGLHVQAIELDPVTAAIAAYNLRVFDTVTVTNADATAVDLNHADAIWCDPARRSTAKGSRADGSARRITDPQAFAPPLNWVIDAARQVKGAGIKLSPALDHDLIPPGWEAQWVSHNGDVVEATLYTGNMQGPPGRNALVMWSGEPTTATAASGPASSPDSPAAGSLKVHESELPTTDEPLIGTLGEYLFEPDGAIVRAGLVTALCEPLAARRMSPTIAYLTGDTPPTGLSARAVSQYRIVDILPASIKALRRELTTRGIHSVVIKKRGMDIVPEQVRRQLKLPRVKKAPNAEVGPTSPTSATLIFTRLGERHVVLLTQPV